MNAADHALASRAERFVTWPCTRCRSRGLCAADCPFGPWNYDSGSGREHPRTTRLGYLIRQRRWVGGPVPREEIFFREGDRYPASRIVILRVP